MGIGIDDLTTRRRGLDPLITISRHEHQCYCVGAQDGTVLVQIAPYSDRHDRPFISTFNLTQLQAIICRLARFYLVDLAEYYHFGATLKVPISVVGLLDTCTLL